MLTVAASPRHRHASAATAACKGVQGGGRARCASRGARPPAFGTLGTAGGQGGPNRAAGARARGGVWAAPAGKEARSSLLVCQVWGAQSSRLISRSCPCACCHSAWATPPSRERRPTPTRPPLAPAPREWTGRRCWPRASSSQRPQGARRSQESSQSEPMRKTRWQLRLPPPRPSNPSTRRRRPPLRSLAAAASCCRRWSSGARCGTPHYASLPACARRPLPPPWMRAPALHRQHEGGGGSLNGPSHGGPASRPPAARPLPASGGRSCVPIKVPQPSPPPCSPPSLPTALPDSPQRPEECVAPCAGRVPGAHRGPHAARRHARRLGGGRAADAARRAVAQPVDRPAAAVQPPAPQPQQRAVGGHGGASQCRRRPGGTCCRCTACAGAQGGCGALVPSLLSASRPPVSARSGCCGPGCGATQGRAGPRLVWWRRRRRGRVVDGPRRLRRRLARAAAAAAGAQARAPRGRHSRQRQGGLLLLLPRAHGRAAATRSQPGYRTRCC